ncbi:MAG: TraB/GumN family protein [Candidatus Omnitrophota bacterium]
MRRLILSFLLLLIVAFPAFSETSLWKVQSDTTILYIGGTCHILRKSDYPLPKEFDQAYEDADIIIFETDIKNMFDPGTQQAMIRRGTYSDGTTLDQVLTTRAYDALKQYCKKIGVPISSFHQFKPAMVMLTLLGLELERIGVYQNGVDFYFYQKAIIDEKRSEGLETIEEQIEIVTLIGEGNESDFVLYSIRDLKETRAAMEEIIVAWKTADEEKLKELLIGELSKECPDLYEALFVARNRKWLFKIVEYLKTPQKELVLVGVGHLIGEDGIIEQLRRRGYKVEKDISTD